MTVHPFKVKREEDALARVRELAKDSNKVVITQHAIERMGERNITRTQINRCLLRGVLDEAAETDLYGNWKLKLKHRTAGVSVSVVAALQQDENGDLVIVVTAF